MSRMRTLSVAVPFAVAALAAPATAQVSQFELDNIRAQQAAVQRQAVETANQTMALEARLRTEQAIRDLEDQRVSPTLPTTPYPIPPGSAAPSGGGSTAQPVYPSIPDKALADSNRRIQKIRKHRQ